MSVCRYFYTLLEFKCFSSICDLVTTSQLPLANEWHRTTIKIQKNIDRLFLFQGIPAECRPILERCLTNKIIDVMPDQLTVNQYESGQGW